MSAIGQKINNLVSSTQENFQEGFSDFGNNRYVGGTREFLNSNSLVAKFSFLILVIIVFVFCFNDIYIIINYI